jgi:hypothetical protein
MYFIPDFLGNPRKYGVPPTLQFEERVEEGPIVALLQGFASVILDFSLVALMLRLDRRTKWSL